MPRVTSFFSDDPTPKTEGREWLITGTPQHLEDLFAKPNVAHRGDRSVELVYALDGSDRYLAFSYDQRRRWVYKACLVIGAKSQTFTIRESSGQYEVKPETCQIKRTTRYEISIQGVGKATFRNAWKDSDSKAHIVGFVDVVCDNEADEEALVWFAGTLGSYGLPRPPSG